MNAGAQPAQPGPLVDPRGAPRRGSALGAWARSIPGLIGAATLALMTLLCLATLPWTMSPAEGERTPRYRAENLTAHRLPPSWAPHDEAERARRLEAGAERARERLGREPTEAEARAAAPVFLLGSDALGRDVFVRCLAGGGISLGIGISAAAISVLIGTIYGMVAGYAGGRTDATMMRIVDVLYGLPYILLVVLLAVAVDAVADQRLSAAVERSAELRAAYVEARLGAGEGVDRAALEAEAALRHPAPGEATRGVINIVTLLVAIGGVSWLTMARVIRGQTLSLKGQPFVEAARAVGASPARIFARHLLPNLVGPIVVYATLTVPQAILQESFLSFLGIGVSPPTPSWGNLAADGLPQLNTVKSRWWLLVFPCALLGVTLLALNFVGEGLRDALDPRRRGGRS